MKKHTKPTTAYEQWKVQLELPPSQRDAQDIKSFLEDTREHQVEMVATEMAELASMIRPPEMRAGNPELLKGNSAVTMQTSAKYLGCGLRNVQKLIRNGKLDTQGLGQFKRVTVASLKRYRPPKTK